MAQESTFTAEIRSHANAYGLMQIIPGTGRTCAQAGHHAVLHGHAAAAGDQRADRDAVAFKELATKFGGAHFALAGYNAGGGRVERWLAERPGIPQDEFIDDIPFPETQAYVKRILGTAEDYRALYGAGPARPDGGHVACGRAARAQRNRTGSLCGGSAGRKRCYRHPSRRR